MKKSKILELLECERQCILRNSLEFCKKAMFHQWIIRAQVAPPSPMVGGEPGGQLMDVFGLVEMEDGHMKEVYPYSVVFADGGDFATTAFKPIEEQKR